MTRAASRPETAERREPPRRLPALFLVTIAFGTVLQPLNSSMIAVALVPISAHFHAGSEVSWLVSGLYLTTAVAAPAMGRLADLFGPRRVYLAGMALIGLASAATPVVPDLGWLIVIRVVLGIGTAAQYPAGVALIRRESERVGAAAVSALGLLAISGQVTVALGPSLGGVLVGAFGWPAVFLVNLPVVVLGSALALRALPPGGAQSSTRRAARAGQPPTAAASQNRRRVLRELDLPGMALFTVAMTALMAFLLSIITGTRWWLLPVAGAGALVLLWWEPRAGAPFLDVRTLRRNRALTSTYLRVGLTYTAFYLIFYGLPQWLEQGRRLSPSLSGLVILPLAALGAVTVAVATRLERARGPRPLLVIGSAALVLGGVVLATLLHSATAVWVLVGLSALLGLPNGFNNLGNQSEMYRAAGEDSVGSASGLYRTSQYVGANLAAAVMELTFAGPPSDPGLHRMGLVVAAIAVVLLVAAVRAGRGRRSARAAAGSGG